ncbi:MAG: hypothetical protein ACP5QM_07720 [Caldisericum sp.]|uniref:hypothetical protein n=1 Tax=Caldisericum sp. TaxID=2499687 RepID=UPI003D0BBA01
MKNFVLDRFQLRRWLLITIAVVFGDRTILGTAFATKLFTKRPETIFISYCGCYV